MVKERALRSPEPVVQQVGDQLPDDDPEELQRCRREASLASRPAGWRRVTVPGVRAGLGLVHGLSWCSAGCRVLGFIAPRRTGKRWMSHFVVDDGSAQPERLVPGPLHAPLKHVAVDLAHRAG